MSQEDSDNQRHDVTDRRRNLILARIAIGEAYAGGKASVSGETASRKEESQFALPLDTGQPTRLLPIRPGSRAIEDDEFPFESLSDIAELESWRKEIYRPLSHIHKWWAQRLGTVFRAILIGAMAPKGEKVLDLLYEPIRSPHTVIFDPFMGSGTTVVEGAKLGSRVVGRDINPVAYFLVRNALAAHDRTSTIEMFHAIEKDVANKLQRFFVAQLPDGQQVPVLYYFWVMTIGCPGCSEEVDLFPSYVFAQHAYAKKFPEARAICPHCGSIELVRFDANKATCQSCAKEFDPSLGPARGKKARCPHCSCEFEIAKIVRSRGKPPNRRLYAKLVLMPDGAKKYAQVDDFDLQLYEMAEDELQNRLNAFPNVEIEPGYNTNQILGYNYRFWHELFNARQLLGLSILSDRIRGIADPALRDLFTCLFSGALEFNNMFASYKGEGTGAVRHMFYHHILKPERVPLEANLWGTPRSSGAFSTMFENRILRAIDYGQNPFELRVPSAKKSATKVYGLSKRIGHERADNFLEFDLGKPMYLSCGDSSQTDLRASSVDLVVTDPPFFDNVHYSQLADFFHVWQRHILGEKGYWFAPTTRSPAEVQNSDEIKFTDRLTAVWKESHRVLKDEGLLIFTYHHSRSEGWRSVLKALMDSEFEIVATHPIKSEMSVATPKHQAKNPIDLDIVVVCRKAEPNTKSIDLGDLWNTVTNLASDQVTRLRNAKRMLSRNDIRIIVMAQLLRQLTSCESTDAALNILDCNPEEIETAINQMIVQGSNWASNVRNQDI